MYPIKKNNATLCDCNCLGFKPSVSFSITGTDITFNATATAYDSGDSIGTLRASVFDQNGNEAYNQANAASVVVDASDLDLSKITLKVFLLSTKGCKADLAVAELIPTPTTSGTMGSIALAGDTDGE